MPFCIPLTQSFTGHSVKFTGLMARLLDPVFGPVANARILTKSPRREHITPVLMKLHWLKIQDRIIYKMLMLTYKSYYNMAPPYLCELINKKESHVNTRLGTDHHQLIMPPISIDCSNTFLERSFIYAAPCEWNKLSEHIRTSNFDCFRKSVKTMLFTQQYGC